MENSEFIDDTDPQFSYEPVDAWSLKTTDFRGLNPHNMTAHGTTQAHAKASIQFKGALQRSVSVVCLVWLKGALFTATLDGNYVGTYTTVAWAPVSNYSVKPMFTIDNLNDTSHTYTLVLEKAPDGRVDPLYIDSMIIRGVPDSPSSSTSPSQSPSQSQLPSSPSSTSSSQSSFSINSDSLSRVPSLSTPAPQSQTQTQIPPSATSTHDFQSPSSSPVPSSGAIAGIVCGMVVVIALIVAFIWYRRRLTRVGHLFFRTTPFIEAETYPDDKRPGQVIEVANLPTVKSSSLAPVSKQAVALVSTFSLLEKGTVAAAATITNEIPPLDAGDAGPSLNPTASSIAPPSVPLPSSSISGRVNITLQEYSMLRDQVRHLAALRQTGGLGVLNEDEGHSNYHEPPPEYVERGSDEGSQP